MRIRHLHQSLTLLSSVSMVAALAGGAYAQAQPGDQSMETVVVTGVRASLDRALTTKRETLGVVDSISSESIGKFPDQNVAESLQRIPGVSIDRSSGEGHAITVRGFGPQFNTVLLNNRLLATENPGREFSFDILPSNLISGADVFKTAEANKQEGGIGSTVILRTARPLDNPGFRASVSAGAKFDGTTNIPTPDASVLISDTNNEGTFGILAALSYYKREYRTDSVATSGWISQSYSGLPSDAVITGDFHPSASNDTVYFPRTFGFAQERGSRERIGGMLSVDWVVSDKLKLTMDGLYTHLSVDSKTHSTGWWTDPGDIQAATFDAEGTALQFVRRASGGLKTDNVEYETPTNADSFQIGLHSTYTPASNTVLEVDLSHSNAHNKYLTYFDVIGEPIVGTNPTFDLNAGSVPTISGVGLTYDPNNAYLHCCNERGQGVDDDIWQMSIDGHQKFDAGILDNVSVGLQGTRRKKTIDNYIGTGPLDGFYGGYYAQAYPVSAAHPDGMTFREFSPGSILGEPAVSWLDYNHADLVRYYGTDTALSQNGSTEQQALFRSIYAANGYSTRPFFDPRGSGVVRELTFAAYAQAEFKGEIGSHDWDAIAGVRYVYTDEKATGHSVTLTGIVFNPADPTDAHASYTAPLPVTMNNGYGTWLPSLTFRFNWSEDLVGRASIARTLTRPTLTQLTVAQNFTFRPPDQSTISSGNPNLQPYLAWNYDLGVDYYLGKTSYVSVAGFMKQISNFVSNVTQMETLFGLPFQNTRPVNANNSEVYGFEATVQYVFDELLPAPFDGFGVSANYTKVESSTSFDPALTTQVFNIEGLSDSYNAVVFYEKGPVSIRAAYNWRAPFLRATFGNNGLPDNVDAYGQVDLSASYKVFDQSELFVDVINLTDERQRLYSSFKTRFEGLYETGRIVTAGVRATF